MPTGSLGPRPKPIFKDIVIATTGDLDKRGWADSDISRYMGHWGGRFSADLDESVTHLLATKQQFKDNHPRVKAAKKRKKFPIVTLDWVEDSMTECKILGTDGYSLHKIQRSENKVQHRAEQATKEIENAVGWLHESMFRPYTDSTAFQYKITLTRGDQGERYIVWLYESVPKPHLYLFAYKYYKSRRHTTPTKVCPSETQRHFEGEYDQFCKFFKIKTGIHWDDRMKPGIAGSSDKFIYQPPTGGKPVGLVNGKVYEFPDEGEHIPGTRTGAFVDDDMAIGGESNSDEEHDSGTQIDAAVVDDMTIDGESDGLTDSVKAE